MKQRLLYTAIVGTIFVILGLAAFGPAFTTANEHGHLVFGLFQTNELQTYMQLMVAILALAVLAVNKLSFVIFFVHAIGIFFTVLAVWGIPAFFGAYDGALFGTIHLNWASELLYLLIGLSGLYFGFIFTHHSVRVIENKPRKKK